MKFSLRYFALACAAGLMALLCACGQKGRLVMPIRPPAISTPYPVAEPKPVTDSDQMDDTAPPSEAKPDVDKDTPAPKKENS